MTIPDLGAPEGRVHPRPPGRGRDHGDAVAVGGSAAGDPRGDAGRQGDRRAEASGIPEAIVSDEHGLLTPPGDVSAPASALQTLISDPAYRLRLARQAQDRALAEFTIGAMTDACEELYRAALE